ncbi:MAG TPA: HDIG domain-containing protein [Dissulfurispiraceae bacterium]|nr:HDIG domain-containing protein [Dissulfurispiraceae bacterium]
MSDLKNVRQKTKSRQISSLKKKVAEYPGAHRNELQGIGILALISAVIALILQDDAVPAQHAIGIAHYFGSLLISLLILFIFFKDIKRYKPAYFGDNKMMGLLALLVVGTLLVSRLFGWLLSALHRGLDLPLGDSFIFGIPIAAGAMLITLIFDFHLAISFSFVMSLLSGVWLHNPFFPIYTFVGSLTAAFSVLRCRRRSTLIQAGIYVCIANVLTAAMILLAQGQLFSVVAPSSFLFGILAGVSVIALVTSMLPVIEYSFGLRTDISLVELLDHDQPLLKNLMVNAPGTYHHSIIVGNLAEAAAEAVGVNPLMARVTAYYHDIGKVKMPDYFVENQAGPVSRHEKLTPHMSSIILISHVKEGVELAKQHKLPKPVIDIIQEHHGTGLMTFFYQRAVEQSDGPPPNHEEYRYPGPRPQTRIAALVMMADAVEAATRSLSEPTPARIEAMVEKIINNIFLDGQIDECELTLKDLSAIKDSFVHVLLSIFHKRIQYPEVDVRQFVNRQDKPLISDLPSNNGGSDKESPKSSEASH